MLNHYGVVDKLFREHFGNKQVVGIEIGTGTAVLTRHILWALPNVTLHTIDSFEHRDGAEFEAGNPQELHDITKATAYERLLAPEFKDRVTIYPVQSSIAFSQMPKEVDFVWIDGDHSEKGITTDLDLYAPLVKSGGILGGHDYGQVHPLTEIITSRYGDKINSGDDFTWWIYV